MTVQDGVDILAVAVSQLTVAGPPTAEQQRIIDHDPSRPLGFEMADDLDVVGLGGPRRLRGVAILHERNRWSADLAQALAAGTWPGEEIP